MSKFISRFKQYLALKISKFINFNKLFNKFNKIHYKETLILLLNKVIGQAKTLFNRITKKKSTEVIPDGVLGVSINNGIVALAHVVVNSLQDIEVKSFGLFDINLTNVEGGNKEPKSAQSVITQYIKDQHLERIVSCYVLSPSEYVLSLIESVENDNKAKEKAILWGVKDYINYSIDDAILESFEIPAARAQDNVKLAYAVAMRAKLSEEIGNLINSSGAHLKYIDINELCLRNIMSLYSGMESGCLLLKLAEGNSSILLIKDNSLFISRNTKLDIKQLDQFDPRNNISSEKFNIAENLVLELQRSLDYSNSMFRDLHFNTIKILPHNINLDLFIPWAEEQLGLPINKVDLTEKIKFAQEIKQSEQAGCLLAIGAALRNIGNVINVATN